ncbi:FixH family protein [Flexibacterium corallicola]|uniref:FixH family protein n=1 Tax=Flexibacterium corallicola TaxID=3037259 RepID=UPI00286F1E95|nr:FixH family protein [Pseudovibrio sp. M1P-2-3]
MAVSSSTTQGTGPRTIKGWHVLAAFCTFFGIIFTANAYLIYIAVETFPGLEVESSYEVSQGYNSEIARAKAQAVRGWQVNAQVNRNNDGSVNIGLDALDKEGNPISPQKVQVTFQRPTITTTDVVVPLLEQKVGRYVGNLEHLAAGNWTVIVEAFSEQSDAKPAFVSRNRTYLED